MRIGLLIYGSLDTLSGGYLYDRKLVETLQQQGDQVELVSLPWRSYARHLADNLSAGLRRQMLEARFDVLLQDELNHPSLFWLNRRLAGRVSYPIVSIVHHLRSLEQRPAWQNRLYRRVEQVYLQSADGFIFNSQTTRAAVQAAGAGLSRLPWLVAYPGGDQLQPWIGADELAERSHQPGPLRLLFVGNLIPRKGLHTLLAALERLPEGLCMLSVVGRPDADPRYAAGIQRRILASPRLQAAVRLLGRLDDAGLGAAYRTHHVLVVPSTYEGFGIAYLEAMGFGLPAIAATAGAAGEIITHGQDGFLVPPGQPAVLAAHLAQFAHDRHRLQAAGLAARRRYRSHPTWEQTGLQIRTFLSAMIGQKFS